MRTEQQEREAMLIETLQSIMAVVCGNRSPRWDTDEHVYASREAISNACEAALSAQPVAQQAPEQEPAEPAHLLAEFERGRKAGITEVHDAIRESAATQPQQPLSELEAAEKDAARYRWLCSDLPSGPARQERNTIILNLDISGQGSTDAAIDKAMTKEPT